jgi:zinc protease
LILDAVLFSPDHRYNAPIIGPQDGLRGVDLETVGRFFREHYAPGNATLVLAGDFDPGQARRWIETWYGAVPPGELPPPRSHAGHPTRVERRVYLEDDVREPRLYAAYATPGLFRPADAPLDVLADLLASGPGSLLHDRLVSASGLARAVRVTHAPREYAGVFTIEVTPAPDSSLTRVLGALDSLLAEANTEPFPEERVHGTVRRIQARLLRAVESTGGRADRMAAYLVSTGRPDFLAEDLARYEAIGPSDITGVASTYLRPDRRVLLSVVPLGAADSALPESEPALPRSEPTLPESKP